MFARPSAAAAYAKVGVESHVTNADPHQLILMLFDGALLAINSAAIAMERGDIEARVKNITKAIEIITMGLKASLDAQGGGELAERLGALYDYMCSRLLHANAFSTDAPLVEVAGLLRDLRDAWSQIANASQAESQEA
ncbi:MULTISPECIES: flagellar export chaperone FliS [Uliginosibacterium]|uniref:Flagellar secretion chaperone FliS n=1 Tax=Uliginosibacterium aquaticum TaxID=2731212 RepID=A0ABX2IJL5_9RHOO|nr:MULTISPECIES: flagellar export chaperone FliS [Uliginosibacterium]MDO6385103.1 flagellar export chaperone FliS [Uliginosibacterium sp. 31-12]NSL55182.1 flagellar export chaperone FliS [Uliginosibacterium aquaticum]PLK48780.1 flagellar export chaperone FliS [Uliginosibacterium sp. TH139]